MASAESNGNAESANPSDDLEALAMAELLEESKRAQDRTSTMGVVGWTKPPSQTIVNKVYFIGSG